MPPLRREDAAADIAFCTFQPFNCGLLGFLAAKDTDKCLAGLKIRCHLNSCHRSHRMNSGVLDLAVYDGAEFFLNCTIHTCIFNAVLIPTEVLKYPESLIKKYVDSVFYDSKFASFVFRKGDRGHAKLAKTIDDMVEKADIKEDAYEFDMIACGYKLMAEIIKRLNCKGAEKIGVSPWADTLHKMIAFIQFNYKEPIKLEEIAEAGNVSRSQCCKIFKEIINRSPNDYLVEYRIDKSIDLIMKTDMKMTEIAYECGFNGSSYFAETFKKIVGVSPREYKNKEKKKCTTI